MLSQQKLSVAARSKLLRDNNAGAGQDDRLVASVRYRVRDGSKHVLWERHCLIVHGGTSHLGRTLLGAAKVGVIPWGPGESRLGGGRFSGSATFVLHSHMCSCYSRTHEIILTIFSQAPRVGTQVWTRTRGVCHGNQFKKKHAARPVITQELIKEPIKSLISFTTGRLSWLNRSIAPTSEPRPCTATRRKDRVQSVTFSSFSFFFHSWLAPCVQSHYRSLI
jgi:hypothetical protein